MWWPRTWGDYGSCTWIKMFASKWVNVGDCACRWKPQRLAVLRPSRYLIAQQLRGSTFRTSGIITGNNSCRMSWLFTLEDMHAPSVYLRLGIKEDDRVGFVKGRVSEALRLAAKSPSKQRIYPYCWFKYQDNSDKFLTEVSPFAPGLSIHTDTLRGNVWRTSTETSIPIVWFGLRRKTWKTHSRRSPISTLTVWSSGVARRTWTASRNVRICCNMWRTF